MTANYLMDVQVEFFGKLGKYKIIETEDQTKTLWSEYFDEACHNLSGAYNETLHNYIEGCQIPEQISMGKNICIFDVGFGLGIGLKAFIDEIKKHEFSSPRSFSYTSMELDEDLYLWSVNQNFPDLVFTKIENYYQCVLQIGAMTTLSVTIYIGDGRLTIPQAFKEKQLPKFTAIFQDAFSPKKNPALWTVEWFNLLKSASDPEVYLSTYSASVSIRKSMIAAGWKISNARGFGQKRTMTKGRLIGETEPVLAAELAKNSTLELHDI